MEGREEIARDRGLDVPVELRRTTSPSFDREAQARLHHLDDQDKRIAQDEFYRRENAMAQNGAGRADAKEAEPIRTVDERDAMFAVREVVARRRANFQIRTSQTWNRMATFSRAFSNALGEVSIDEALGALRREFDREIVRLQMRLIEDGAPDAGKLG